MSTKTKKAKKETPKKEKKVDGRVAAGAKRKGPASPMWKRTKESGGTLTPRQQQILRLVTLGCNVREIALLLGLSPSTVDNHKAAMMTALGCNKAVLLVRLAIKLKLSKPEETLTKSEIAALGGYWTDGWNRV